MSRPSKRKNQPESTDNHGGYLPDYQTMQKKNARNVQWRAKKIGYSSSVCLFLPYIPLCLVRERNCFQKHHNICFICFH